jgi:hypothetical protein
LSPEAKLAADALARATDELVTAVCDLVATGSPRLAGSSPWERGESDSLDIDPT